MCRDGWTCARGGGARGAGEGFGGVWRGWMRGGAACLTVRACACMFEREKGRRGCRAGLGEGSQSARSAQVELH